MLVIYAKAVDLFIPSIFMNKIKYSRGWLCGAVRATHITNFSFAETLERGMKLGEWRFYWRIRGEAIEKGVHNTQEFQKGYVICYSIHKNTSCSIKTHFLKLTYNNLFISWKLFNFFEDP